MMTIRASKSLWNLSIDPIVLHLLVMLDEAFAASKGQFLPSAQYQSWLQTMKNDILDSPSTKYKTMPGSFFYR